MCQYYYHIFLNFRDILLSHIEILASLKPIVWATISKKNKKLIFIHHLFKNICIQK